jgi:hypothetical protein
LAFFPVEHDHAVGHVLVDGRDLRALLLQIAHAAAQPSVCHMQPVQQWGDLWRSLPQ